MSENIYHNDGLRQLFEGFEPAVPSDGFNVRLTARIAAAAAARERKRERLGEILSIAAAVLLIIGGAFFVMLRYDFTSFAQTGAKEEFIQPSVEQPVGQQYAWPAPNFEMLRMPSMPDFTPLEFPAGVSSMVISMVCVMILLVGFDHLMRKAYYKRHREKMR